LLRIRGRIKSCPFSIEVAADLILRTPRTPRTPRTVAARHEADVTVAEPPLASLDLTTDNDAARRALFALVVLDNFAAKVLDPPEDVWIPLYTPEEAGLEGGSKRTLRSRSSSPREGTLPPGHGTPSTTKACRPALAEGTGDAIGALVGSCDGDTKITVGGGSPT
jgi:hypothetical protein